MIWKWLASFLMLSPSRPPP